MNKTETKLFLEILSEIPDHRHGNGIRHRLDEIITIALLGILCNANTLTGLERFGKTHEKELRQFLELPNGIPSHDTFGDVLGRLDYTAIDRLFQKWLGDMHGNAQARCIAIDGKTVRRSESTLHKAAHIVSAYSSDLQLVLGQVITDEKSNEITAIPELLDSLDIKGATVTIDAMGTQKTIAQRIVDRGGDYILALKENQKTLLEDANYYFTEDYLPTPKSKLRQKGDYAYTIDKGHGRLEKRECWLMREGLSGLQKTDAWAKLQGIAVIRSTRTVGEKEPTITDRYFLFSHDTMNAKDFLSLQRQHWAIENTLHWTLDIVFREDSTHARVEHIAIVLNMFRKLILQMLKHDTTIKDSMAGKREICAWNFDRALNVLRHACVS